MGTTASDGDCRHYQRKCMMVAPCCGKTVGCRLCHDDVENHQLNRRLVEKVVCIQCNLAQKVSKNCIECGILFGSYSCLVCRLFDDDQSKGQFHCDLCGICRVGGRDKFFHCTKCNMCLSKGIEESHKCLQDASKGKCPVCLEEIHTSRRSLHVPDCSHIVHRSCFEEMMKHNNYACPVCNRSMTDMSACWRRLDLEVEGTIMPPLYQNYHVKILCRDCQKESKVKFHVIGLKCQECGSYNTTRIGGDDPLPTDPLNSLQELVEELNDNVEADDSDGWETVSSGEDISENMEAVDEAVAAGSSGNEQETTNSGNTINERVEANGNVQAGESDG